MALQWSHTVLYVRDLELMLDFYQKVLGFEVSDRAHIGPEDGPQIAFLSQVGDHHHQVAFVDVRKDEDPPNSVDHNAFRVDDLAEVRAFKKKLEDDGRASQINPLTHGNTWSVYFKDPEGNGIEIFCDTPWHVGQPQIKTWDPELSDEELVAWTRKEFEGERGFGPIDAYYAERTEHFRKRENT